MHESGLCEPLVEAIKKRAEGRRVARIAVRVGVLHRVVDDHFRYHFEEAAVGSECQGCDIDLEIVPVTGTCQDCGHTFGTDDFLAVCPECEGVPRLEGGDELTLVSLEYAQPVES